MMPLATTKQARDFARNHGRIRLTCLGSASCCDLDGIRLIPRGWSDVVIEQTLQESLSIWDDDELPQNSRRAYAWWTHSGYCPECTAEGKS